MSKQLHYRVGKTLKWEASHQLGGLPEGHPCSRVHGHSYRAEVVLSSSRLDDTGFVLDFNYLKAIRDKLDHQHLNDVMGPENPTAENIAKFIMSVAYDILFRMGDDDVVVERVTVWETDTCWAEVTAVEK